MINFKNSIVVIIIAALCFGQHVLAEFTVINNSGITVEAILQLPNRPVAQILNPNERWVVDASTHDKAEQIRFGTGTRNHIVARKSLKDLKDWNTLTLLRSGKGNNAVFSIDTN